MSKAVIPLNDTQIKNAKPKEKDYQLSDGKGLALLITKDGGKWWRFNYISPIDNKRKLISFGTYPDVSLAKARDFRSEARQKIKDDIDPSNERKTQQISQKLDENGQVHLIVFKWLDNIKNKYDENTHAKRVKMFNRDFLPYFSKYDKDRNLISSRHIKDITQQDILYVIREKEKTAVDTAGRLFSDCIRVWKFAFSEGAISSNMTINISKQDSFQKHQKKHYPKVTDEKILSELLNSIDQYHGDKITRFALKLVCYLPLRASNLCTLKWDYVDLSSKIITIPRNEMKVKDKNLPDFKIPLSDQAVRLLIEIKQLTGWGIWVFHGKKDFHKPINKETCNKALRLMGYNDENEGRKQRTHSFRGTFRSLADTNLPKHNASYEAREAVLDHHKESSDERAYLHEADYTEQVRPLLQWWANHLEELKTKKF